ncbi:UNVERIFIED_CONTAM: hypothetical protein FKN15_042094 [Acipenser sinensis]
MRALDSGIAGTDNSFVEVMGLIQRMYKQTAIAKAGALKDYITMMLENEKLKFLVFAHHLTMLQACKEAVIEAKAGALKDYITMMLENEKLKFLVFAHHLTMLQACKEAVIEAKFEKEKQHDIRTFFSPRAGKENKRKRPTEESPAGTPNDEDKAEMTILNQAEGESVNGTTQSVASSSAMPSQTAADSQEKGYLQALDAEGNPLCICCQLPSLQVNTAWDTRFCSQRCQEEFLVRSNQSYKSQGLRNGIQSLSAVQSPRPRTLPVHQRRSRSQQEGDTGEHLDVTAVSQSGNIPLQRLFISNRIQISRFVSIAKTKTTTIGQMLM